MKFPDRKSFFHRYLAVEMRRELNQSRRARTDETSHLYFRLSVSRYRVSLQADLKLRIAFSKLL